jgi:signal transduction histidine kinase/putative methionine-R-sulfoxide reductase with GAF domain/ActR/RegA family two-component response regulator
MDIGSIVYVILGFFVGIIFSSLIYLAWNSARGHQANIPLSQHLSYPDELLQQQLQELTILQAVATAGAQATEEDALIERATQIIGENLYSDNYGLLLIDETGKFLRPHPSYHELSGKENTPIPVGMGICGKVATLGKPIRVGDVSLEPAYLQVDPETKSELCVPLNIAHRVIGVINVESRRLDAFSPTDEHILETVAGQLVTAIERLRAEETIHRRANQLAVLSQVSQDVVASLIPEQVYQSIHQAASQLIKIDVFEIDLLDDQQQVFKPIYMAAKELPGQAKASALPNELTGHILMSGEIILSNDRDELVKRHIIASADDLTARSLLAVPMRSGDRIFGLISCQSYFPNAYALDDLQVLQTLANQSSIAIENAKLFVETQQRLSEITFLSEIIAITATESDLTIALNRICAELANFLDVTEVGFALLNSQLTAAQLIAEYHEPGRPDYLGVQIPVIGNPAMGYILQSANYLVIADARTDPLLGPMRNLIEQRGIISLLMMPIIFGGEVVGTLETASTQSKTYSQAEISLVEKVASQVGQVLERLGLFAATREQAEQMAHLASISEGLNRPLSMEEVIKGIGEGAMALGQADRGVLFLRQDDGTISAPWYENVSEHYINQAISQSSEEPGSQLPNSIDPLLIPDLSLLPDGSWLQNLGKEEGYQAVDFWPVVYRQKVVAIIGCYYDTPHIGSDAEQEVMLAFSRQVAIALVNSRLFEETRQKAIQLEAINTIITEVASASDLDHLLKSILEHTMRALDAPMGSIWVAGHQVSTNLSPESCRIFSEISAGITAQNYRVEAIRSWQELDRDNSQLSNAALFSQAGIGSSLLVPLLSVDKPTGYLAIALHDPHTWFVDEISLVEGVCRQLGGAVERLELLERIQENARQVQQIIDTVPEGVVLLDQDSRIILANPAAQEYLLTLAGVQSGDFLNRLGDKSINQLLQIGSAVRWSEIELNNPSQQIFELAAQPLETSEPRGGWVLVLRNVTQERENQSRIQMQERLATVGHLAAGIAHDFNNIMAAIVVYADLLKRDPNLLPISRERLDIITQQVQRAATLIRQILDFSRRSVMEQGSLDLLPFVKELEKLLRRVLPETIRLELAYQPGTYLVKADPTRLQQVFMNLAVNARDATPSGGALRFKLEKLSVQENLPPPCPDIPPGVWIRITVQDTGEGIPPEVVPHIFEPFFTTKPVGQGTGLGLAQVYGIIKQHNGHIDVHSQIDAGTTFHIYLPAQEAESDDLRDSQETADVRGAGETVLLVEDNHSTREALRTLLEDYNYQVLTASNGLEALQIFEQQSDQIALVISDIVMPHMGGMELFQNLQKRKPDITILFITGHPVNEEDQRILEIGRVHWLQKPFSVSALSEKVRSLVRNPSTLPRSTRRK